MATTLFDLNVQGSGSVGQEAWIDLAAIPTGSKIFLGNARYSSPDKSLTFELRGNLTGMSLGNINATTLLDTVSVSPRSGTLLRDLFRNGRLHIATVIGTGTERLWLRLKSKSGTLGSYIYSINYTLE